MKRAARTPVDPARTTAGYRKRRSLSTGCHGLVDQPEPQGDCRPKLVVWTMAWPCHLLGVTGAPLGWPSTRPATGDFRGERDSQTAHLRSTERPSLWHFSRPRRRRVRSGDIPNVRIYASVKARREPDLRGPYVIWPSGSMIIQFGVLLTAAPEATIPAQRSRRCRCCSGPANSSNRHGTSSGGLRPGAS